jgi:hypothetical protein
MAVENYTYEYTNFGGETLRKFRFERSIFVSGPTRYITATFRGISNEDVDDFSAEKLEELKESNLAPGNVFYSPALREKLLNS